MVNARRSPFAALVLGGLSAVVLAAPSLAETVSTAEAQRVLAAMPDVVSARPTGLQYAVAPPCGSPCAPPCAPPCPDPCANPCWDRCPHYHVSIGMWAWGMEGTMGDDGFSVDVDDDWTDSLENLEDLEFALDARIRGEWERWSATVMVDGGTLESEVDGGIDTESEFSVWILQGQVGYGLFGGRLGCSPCAPVGCVEVYAGARAWWVNQEIEIDPGTTPPFSNESEESWIDPIVGLRGELHLGDHWSLVAEGDVGGFGVGSDFSWHALGAINYHFSRSFSVGVGWKILDVDYENDDFIWDMQLSGPFIGITFSN